MIETLQTWWELGNHILTQALFLRLMGLIYILAFLSLLVQIKGLFGKRGILPANIFLSYLKTNMGIERYYFAPSLFWLDCRDGSLQAVCIAGILAGLLVLLGLAQGILLVAMLIVLWVCYLSYKSIGQDFLAYQWDSLILEVGFASILFAAAGPSFFALLLLWFIAFKFILMAGLAKVLSGDRTWRTFTAMNYHYETQPLPNRFSWYAQKLPEWLHKLTVAGTFAIEILVPFLFFGPPEVRIAAVALEIFLQLAILLTGNYGPLNLLTIVLMIPLLGDNLLGPLSGALSQTPALLPQWVVAPISIILIALALVQIIKLFLPHFPGDSIFSILSPFNIANSYGLFAVMTTERNEIVLEWSYDGKSWEEYDFKWKPGDPTVAPKWNMPHQPRLDWQMWFAALGRYEDNPWFLNLLGRLMDNSTDVLGLMASGPDNPPKFIRALLYRYHFTDSSGRKKGRWWKRDLIGQYCPTVSMRDI